MTDRLCVYWCVCGGSCSAARVTADDECTASDRLYEID